MALQILQKGPSAMQGALLGLGQGLQQLASDKLAQMRQANEQAQFAKTLREANFEPGVASLISSLPIEQRLKALSPYLQDPNFMGNRNIQPQVGVQPVIPEAIVQEPTIHAAATQQQFRELAGQKPQQSPQLPNAFDIGQEVRRNALGFPESFSPDSVKDLIKQFESFGHQFSPQQRQQIEQQAAQLSQDPAKMAALQQQYEQAVKNNEQMELRRPGYTGQAVPWEQVQQMQQQAPSAPVPQYRQPVKPLTEAEKLGRQAQIERVNKPYNDALDKRIVSADEVLDKGQKMLELLEQGDVASGLSGYKPGVFQNADSQEFSALGDDAAAALSGLQSGVQTISKIKFNKERKATLTQQRETQFRRVKDMMKTVEKILVEGDIRNNLLTSGMQPENMSSQVMKIYSKVKNDIPEVPENAPIGKEFVDPQTGVIWTVGSNRMIFNGFAQRRK